ncbi:hypothetical protein AGOR_G00123390 [Albula goreensis]|uniref:Uncharacterized protein n=1 Tax=Albula goreensis TaxID=1534307 RepID=A0A8T3DG44_9TELE|nr:hypothetical protein AGOR_G00123390 [Albula goreensis]
MAEDSDAGHRNQIGSIAHWGFTERCCEETEGDTLTRAGFSSALSTVPQHPQPPKPVRPAWPHHTYPALPSPKAMQGNQICPHLCCMLFLGLWPLGVASQDVIENTTTVVTKLPNTVKSSTPSIVPSPTYTPIPAFSSTSYVSKDCLTWEEWERWEKFVLMGGAALVSGLLVIAVALSCQVRHLKRQARASRTPRTNVDLVSGMGYPSTSRGGSKAGSREVVGSGVPEAGVRMEEVKHAGIEDGASGEVETAREGREQDADGKAEGSGNGVMAASQSEDSPTEAAKEEVEVLVVV